MNGISPKRAFVEAAQAFPTYNWQFRDAIVGPMVIQRWPCLKETCDCWWLGTLNRIDNRPKEILTGVFFAFPHPACFPASIIFQTCFCHASCMTRGIQRNDYKLHIRHAFSTNNLLGFAAT